MGVYQRTGAGGQKVCHFMGVLVGGVGWVCTRGCVI